MEQKKQGWKMTASTETSGVVNFDMEKTGRPSRWNTLRALRVLNYFNDL
jgi:hypothetical protein